MGISQKYLDEFKELYRKKEGREMSDSEAYEAASNLIGLVKILIDVSIEQQRRKQRLKKEPDGFLLTGSYDCSICHRYPQDERWYDWFGVTCPFCRKAIKSGIVPAFAAQHRDSWYATWQLDSKFGIKSPTARKLVRHGELIARIVPDENGKPLCDFNCKRATGIFISIEKSENFPQFLWGSFFKELLNLPSGVSLRGTNSVNGDIKTGKV